MRVFKHKLDGKHYRLVKQKDSNVNTYIEVDKDNKILINCSNWGHKPQEQDAIIIGFDNLTEVYL
tara:strand:+ start:181 stop:375 length:195 start_codon:yes stop_codon:yes gene_type:complete